MRARAASASAPPWSRSPGFACTGSRPATANWLACCSEAELLDLHAGLRGDLVALALAGYGCELIEALLGEAAHPEVYRLLSAFLDHLAGGGAGPEARLLLELRAL